MLLGGWGLPFGTLHQLAGQGGHERVQGLVKNGLKLGTQLIHQFLGKVGLV
jgi:hypothetical protein